MRAWLTYLLMIASLLPVLGQSGTGGESGRIELLNADRGEYDDRIAPGAQRLKGNVRFKHKEALMRCDSAYLFKDQRVQAFGHVVIDQGDTLRTGRSRALQR